MTQIVAQFCPSGIYLSPTPIVAPPQAISILSCICSCLLLMVSWQVPYLAKGCRPDVNNSLRGDSNSGPILAPLPRPSQSCVRWSYICSCLLTYGFLAGSKGCRPDFNNGLRRDSNSGPILVPCIYSSLTRIMAPPQVIPILNCKHELVQKLF